MSCRPQLHAGGAGDLRAAPFYRTLGYEESAIYLRKILDDQPSE